MHIVRNYQHDGVLYEDAHSDGNYPSVFGKYEYTCMHVEADCKEWYVMESHTDFKKYKTKSDAFKASGFPTT